MLDGPQNHENHVTIRGPGPSCGGLENGVIGPT